ncbi:MAG: hypothetical protein OXF08_06945 [Bacteroidetes bacterium]|nr:hypothetical protein [Bacteroidota bacterium]
MNNRFIACGGTGAHVMLAMIRLHILGYPFGFFFKTGYSLPDLFLVDQDSGDGKDKDTHTPWQEVKHLIRLHPGKYNLGKYLGRPDSPICKNVSPLPVGKNKDWYKPPYHQLKYQFRDSIILELITSDEQREITFDLGMMASPAVGSLLFSLKELDHDEKSNNYDESYNEMLDGCKERRIVVCGSSVGGTGSSVAPTLARLCNDKEGEVMAIMIHNWFQFSRPDESRDIFEKSVERNKRMKQNAAGGLACYGHELADSVPTILVGVPDEKRILRDYTSDNQQPFKDSYAHAIGALAGIKHFLATGSNSIKEGLYGVSASDASMLTGDIIVRDSDEASLKTMLGHAQILVCLLKVYSKLLRITSERNLSKDKSSVFNFFNFAGDTPFPSIAHWAYSQLDRDTASLKYASNELNLIIENYEEILEWIKSFGAETSADLYYESHDVDSKSIKFFCEERQCLKRLKSIQLPDIKELRSSRLSNLKDPEIVALSLFHWVADWITDDWEKANLPTKMDQVPHGQGYWPDIESNDDTGLAPTWSNPGELGKVDDGKIITCIEDYFDTDDVSPNSWPHPFAVTEQFKFLIAKEDPIALRKLEILLIGRALGILEFKEIDNRDTKGDLSLERLIKDEAIAKYRLIHKGNGMIYGFNSPTTLLCPAPDVDDDDWDALRKDIIESDWVDWKNFGNLGEGNKKSGKYVSHHLRGTANRVKEKLMSGDDEIFSWTFSKNWGRDGEKARQAIKGWIRCTKKYIKDAVDKRSRTWFDVFDVYLKTESGSFGIAEWLPLASEDVRIPVPILGPSINIFEEGVPDKEEAEKRYPNFRDTVPEFTTYSVDPESGDSEVFELIDYFHTPGLEFPMKAIWREHLDGLQNLKKIFAWEIDHTERGIWIMQELGDSPIYIRDLIVIDKDMIQIETCIPLEQKRINGSRTKEIKYPDIPLRPEFIDLLKVPEGQKNTGDRCLDHDEAWKALQQSGIPDSGRKLVRWTLDLRGRSKSLPVTVSVEGVEVSKAHWMIWPNFKSDYNPDQPSDLWRAYYVFEQCDKTSLEIQTIYMAHDLKNPLQITKSPQGCPGNAYALSFEDGHHSGGPPLAFSAYDQKLKDTGIYIIGLTKRSYDQQPWKLAIDFGTSHSVAAYQIGIDSETVHLNAELVSEDGLTLHVSENYDVEDASQMGFDLWRPTYLKNNVGNIAKAMLPSDLWSVEEIESVDVGKFQSQWSPMTHYSIPVIQLQRSNIRDHIISGFKWDLTDGKFRNQEQWLRERYLRMAIEIFVADIVKGKSKKLPSKIDATFTYPLRGTFTQATSNYEDIINKVIEYAHKDLGVAFSLKNGRGMYSESHAAFDSVGDGIPINVKLVADLGGGTLDILIRTYDIPIELGNDRFKEVADSVKIGSDLMLKVLAENPNSYLPRGDDRGWDLDPEKAFEQLRAWMRAVGSDKLFGKETEDWHAPDLKLRGFEKSRDGNNGREIINRYFRIIVDFLARYLVAYVANDVWPILKSDSDQAKLKLLVNLRGNGWRLYHGSRDYQAIQQAMEKLVQSRAQELWSDSGISDPLPNEVWHTADLSHENSPKLVPIKKALGKNMDPVKARNNSHRYPLSNVMVYGREQTDTQKNWNERLPFAGVSETDSLHIETFDPPLVVKASGSGEPLAKLEDPLMKEINDKISGGQVVRDTLLNTVDAPIALLIWESLLKSDKFRKL